MIGDLELFLDVYGDQPELQARTKPRDAQRMMLFLIARAATYVHDHTKTGSFGMFICALDGRNIGSSKM